MPQELEVAKRLITDAVNLSAKETHDNLVMCYDMIKASKIILGHAADYFGDLSQNAPRS